ncbi:MAG: class I SAM-dependent methyltransferase [Lachnospiraceae bacterium]|nr:class I SAM-dependent methyltransferase [Lachnospiraceae bacterium]
MFLCSKCKAVISLPKCSKCGFEYKEINDVWQLSDMPDIVVEGDTDKYIGYEYIGENYSGKRKYIIEDKDMAVAKKIQEFTKDGIFLDLACGDGCFTVPVASLGTKVIAGDISNTMLKVLKQKAKANDVSLDNVTLCRMNALDIPLANEIVDTVVANSVLHLISNPEKVVNEIHRVMKKGGCFICIDDVPGKNVESTFDNSAYNNIVNSMYGEYWKALNGYGITPKKFSWGFARNEYCDGVFTNKENVYIERGQYYEMPLKEGFLPRFLARGFSEQVLVPVEKHKIVMQKLIAEFKEKYGEGFDDIVFKGNEEDILLTVYRK